MRPKERALPFLGPVLRLGGLAKTWFCRRCSICDRDTFTMSRVFILQGPLRDSVVTAGGRWSDRVKAAYKSWRDYIIAVKEDASPSYLKYPERVGGISANLVDFVEWRFVVWRGP